MESEQQHDWIREFRPKVDQIGQHLRSAAIRGTVIWIFRKDGSGPLTYVVDDSRGWPAEVEASDVLA